MKSKSEPNCPRPEDTEESAFGSQSPRRRRCLTSRGQHWILPGRLWTPPSPAWSVALQRPRPGRTLSGLQRTRQQNGRPRCIPGQEHVGQSTLRQRRRPDWTRGSGEGGTVGHKLAGSLRDRGREAAAGSSEPESSHRSLRCPAGASAPPPMPLGFRSSLSTQCWGRLRAQEQIRAGTCSAVPFSD